MANNTYLNPALAETTTVIGVTNLKSVGEQPAMLSNLAYSNTVQTTNLSHQNAVSNQQAMNELGISVVGKMVNKVSNLGPLEARSAVDVLTNNELAQTILDLKAAVQAFAAKAANAA
ncbi:RebB family R body protein [Puniceicoccaceae bacterium K14]|nr:RebB family R body protein [Puniceicoccaceae bacterium K14]